MTPLLEGILPFLTVFATVVNHPPLLLWLYSQLTPHSLFGDVLPEAEDDKEPLRMRDLVRGGLPKGLNLVLRDGYRCIATLPSD